MAIDKTRRPYSVVFRAVAVLCLLFVFKCLAYSQITAPSPTSAPTAPPCKDGASPGGVKLVPDSTRPDNKLKLARKHFYLSSSPFNLASTVNLKTVPTLRSYYSTAGASPQLIEWLETNHCETVYCRPLTLEELKCEGVEQTKCVPEFTAAYRNALSKLNGNQELARRMVTNYLPLSSAKLRTGFFEAKTQWLKSAVEAIEKAQGNRIRSTVTDRDGIAFFYNLCPGYYYVSSIGPVEGLGLYWEAAKPVRVKGPPSIYNATVVILTFPPAKDRSGMYVGKPVAEFVNEQKSPAP
jgi:hypothetical protein